MTGSDGMRRWFGRGGAGVGAGAGAGVGAEPVAGTGAGPVAGAGAGFVTRRGFVAAAGAFAFGCLAGCGTQPSNKAGRLSEAIAAGDASARAFVDSCGREVALSAQVERVAPSGPYAQIALLQLAPDKLMGLSSTLSTTQAKYFRESVASLPMFGRLYGGKNATMNFEEIIRADPDVIIDAGEYKSDIAGDLDDLQAQTGLPVVFVQATMDTMTDAYRSLGDVLGVRERADELASWADEAFALAATHRSEVVADGLRVVYATGEYGLDVKQAGSSHNAVLSAVGVDDIGQVTGGGQGEVSIEQMLSWDPDVVLLSPNSYYPDILADKVWQEASAVRAGRVYEVPAEPYSWIDQPPSVQQALGVLWLGNLLYPELYDFDMVDIAREYYALFWGYDLSDGEARALLANSTFARAQV